MRSVGPADLLKFRRDLAVIQVGMVTAVAADDFERVVVAALRLALNDLGWPTPQNHRPVVSGLVAGRHTCLLDAGAAGQISEFALSAARSAHER